MSPEKIARQLVDLCREGKNFEAAESLYSPDVISTEMFGDETIPKQMSGFEAVRRKMQWWYDTHITHATTYSDPLVAGNHFAVRMTFDVTYKPTGQRMMFEEIGVYEVKDGKIISEQFFYSV